MKYTDFGLELQGDGQFPSGPAFFFIRLAEAGKQRTVSRFYSFSSVVRHVRRMGIKPDLNRFAVPGFQADAPPVSTYRLTSRSSKGVPSISSRSSVASPFADSRLEPQRYTASVHGVGDRSSAYARKNPKEKANRQRSRMLLPAVRFPRFFLPLLLFPYTPFFLPFSLCRPEPARVVLPEGYTGSPYRLSGASFFRHCSCYGSPMFSSVITQARKKLTLLRTAGSSLRTSMVPATPAS